MTEKSTREEILSIIQDIYEEIAEMKAILRGQKRRGENNGTKIE